MIILMDIGNSRIKWGWLDEQGLHSGQSLPVAGDFEAILTGAWSKRSKPRRVVVSNVAGDALAQKLNRWLQAHFGISVEWVTSLSHGYGVTSGYLQPECLGCDRWVALVALRHGWNGPACVLDVGTAATFDLIDGNGLHQGGAIIPGLELMTKVLMANTAGINNLAPTGASGLGNNTADAIHIGALHAIVGMAERLRKQAAQTLGAHVIGILTGGNAPQVAACGDDWLLVPDLLLRGLAIIAREEK